MYKASRERGHSFCTRSRATGEGHSLRTVDALVVKMHERPDTPKVKRARSETGGAWSPETIGQSVQQSWSSDEDSAKARSTFSYMVPLTWGMMSKWEADTQWALLLDCPETPWWSWGPMYTGCALFPGRPKAWTLGRSHPVCHGSEVLPRTVRWVSSLLPCPACFSAIGWAHTVLTGKTEFKPNGGELCASLRPRCHLSCVALGSEGRMCLILSFSKRKTLLSTRREEAVADMVLTLNSYSDVGSDWHLLGPVSEKQVGNMPMTQVPSPVLRGQNENFQLMLCFVFTFFRFVNVLKWWLEWQMVINSTIQCIQISNEAKYNQFFQLFKNIRL